MPRTGPCIHISHRVTCVDQDKRRLAAIEEEHISIYEPGIEELVAEVVRRGRLHFTSVLSEVAHEVGVLFMRWIAVLLEDLVVL